jgi:hypothetical protein
MKKRILFIYKRAGRQTFKTSNVNCGWTVDCVNNYEINKWGKGISDNYSLKSLKKKIDDFKPDYIYMTMRKKYEKWLPDLTSIKVPKIYVEVDNFYYNINDSWYKQFDKIYCRQNIWGKNHRKFYRGKRKLLGDIIKLKDYKAMLNNLLSWENVPLFRWSVPEKAFRFSENIKIRKGVYFVGRMKKEIYYARSIMRKRFDPKISFQNGIKGNRYWKLLASAKALVCPSESNFGTFVPTKLFEYSASGSAVLTNCNLKRYQMEDLDKVVIKYKDLDDLDKKLKIDFRPYYGKAREVMKNHTHKIRYKELFG